MFVVHGQLLQRLILGFGQFYDTLHRYPGVMTTPKVNKIQTRLPATLTVVLFRRGAIRAQSHTPLADGSTRIHKVERPFSWQSAGNQYRDPLCRE
jgi:hypothetical protein